MNLLENSTVQPFHTLSTCSIPRDSTHTATIRMFRKTSHDFLLRLDAYLKEEKEHHFRPLDRLQFKNPKLKSHIPLL